MVAPRFRVLESVVGDIFREIDEELRQEHYAKLWQAYGKYVIGAAVALVLATAGAQGWKQYRIASRQADSARYSAATALLVEGRTQDAAALFARLAEDASGGYRVLSRFHQAALRAKGGDVAGAVALYDRLADDNAVDKPLRAAAVVLSVMQLLAGDAVVSPERRERLEHMGNQQSHWAPSVHELMGLLALKEGNLGVARDRFKKLVDDAAAPAGARARAARMLAVIGAQ